MTYAREVTARLLATDGVTVIAGNPLAKSFGHQFMDELSGPGSGSISMPLSEAGAAELTPGRFVQFLIAGTVRQAIQIEGDPEYSSIQNGEELEQVVTVQGRGWACVFDHGIVYPEVALDLNLDSPWRLFSFAAKSFPNAGTWTAADELYEYLDGVTVGVGRWQKFYGQLYPAPVGFPFPTSPEIYNPDAPPGANYLPTYWIWPTGFDTAEGFAFFRRSVTIAAASVVTIAVTADNYFTLFLEGVPILGEQEDHFIWQGWKETTVYLPAGTYQFAAAVENLQQDLAVNPAGFMMDIYYQDGEGQLPKTLIKATDSSWTCVFSDTFWPGWTVGQIVNKLITEATARGAMTAYSSSTFGVLVDTDGNSWDSTDDDTTTLYVPSFAVNVGTTILSALNDLHDNGWVDWHVKPASLILDIWAGGTVGTVTAVTFTAGVNITSLERGPTNVYANSLLVQWERGYVIVTDTVEVTAFGSKIEDIYATEAASEDDATRLGRIELDNRIASAWPAVIMGIEPTSAADCPYEGFTLGDNITVPGVGGGTESAQVLSITVTSDGEGNAIWNIELNRRWQNVARQNNDLFRQIGGRSGTESGTVR